MAVRDERAHAGRLGKAQRLAVLDLAAFSIEPVQFGCEVAEKVQGMSCEARMACGKLDRPGAKTPSLLEPAEQDTGTSERVVAIANMQDDPSRHLALEKLLAFPDPIQRLARLA